VLGVAANLFALVALFLGKLALLLGDVALGIGRSRCDLVTSPGSAGPLLPDQNLKP
jgi:hypothetical protein